MKKQEIKKAVARAKEKFVPKAIQEEAEYQARDEVRRAISPPFDAMKMPDQMQAQEINTAPKNKVFAPDDPKLSGY